MSLYENLICPICKNSLRKEGASLKCERGHSFDFAKSGYINLLNPGKKNNAKAGDSREMIRARSLFFKTGCYAQIRDTLSSLVASLEPRVVIDAGCGEGYYTSKIASDCRGAMVYGLDMSKHGTEHASKVDRAGGITSTLYAVSNIFDIPLRDGCADVVVNAFAPVAIEEFCRVLRSGGYLIICASGEHHLEGLKRKLYTQVYLNEANEHKYEGFELIERKTLSYKTTIEGSEAIWALFQMTPYYHRTSLEDKAKLEGLSSLTTEVEVDFFILRRL